MFESKAAARTYFEQLRTQLPTAPMDQKNDVWQRLAVVDVLPKEWITDLMKTFRAQIAFCFTSNFSMRDATAEEVRIATYLLDHVIDGLQDAPPIEAPKTQGELWAGEGI